MTITGVKKLMNSSKSLELDEISNKSISSDNIKVKLKKISMIIKTLRK